MPGSPTTPGHQGARDDAPVCIAFRQENGVGTRKEVTFAARWLACAYPCRRFACPLAGTCARRGADADRYSFIVVDLHHLLLAGLPAHSQFDPFSPWTRNIRGGAAIADCHRPRLPRTGILKP
jgi:hypothetical protein